MKRQFISINNLLNNSFKFTFQGSIVVSTEIRRDREKSQGNHTHLDSVIVSVKDTGTGINPEVFPRLFEKFTTKSYEGTGLGLYISKNIVEAHGGRIWAKNNNDNNDNKEGATLAFSLPI